MKRFEVQLVILSCVFPIQSSSRGCQKCESYYFAIGGFDVLFEGAVFSQKSVNITK